MKKLSGLTIITVGLIMGGCGVLEESFLTGIIGIGFTIAGLLITWKAEK